MAKSGARKQNYDFLPGGGEMGELIRAYNWASTSIGAIESWPQSLLTAVNILLQSPVPIVMLWGKDGVMIYNDAYSVFAAQRHPKLLGSKVVEGWPEVADFNRNVMKHGLAGETLSYKNQQLTLYRNNAPEEVWMDLNYSPVLDESGQPRGVWAIVVETTKQVMAEQKQRVAEKALKLEQRRLQSVFEQAPALIAVLRGPEHIFEMANPMYVATVAPHRVIVGRPVIEVLPELKGQGVIEILDTVYATGKPYVGELHTEIDRHKTGKLEKIYYSLVYQPIYDGPGGKPSGIFVHAVDISQQVVSRQRAERLRAQLEAVFESLPDGLYIAENDSITHINQRGAEALGYARPEDVPKKLSELYRQLSVNYSGGRALNLEDSTLGNALRGKAVEHIGVTVTNPLTGKRQTLRTAGAPIRDKDENVIGAVAINSDLTEMYALQEKIQKSTVRRRLLMQKARLLKQQNEQLTLLNTTKDEFIALTSHQLRTPATGVKQYIAMLMQGYAGEITDTQKEYLERAYESNERQLQIIEDILRVAKVDMGKTSIHKLSCDIVGLVRNMLDEQADRFRERDQQLVADIPSAPFTISADPVQLHMAIGNIIDNAIKYSPDGTRIMVHLQAGPDYVQLDISDEGVGIGQADLEKLFQKFSRIPNARSIEVGGTGLGLYWTKRIIELHSGSISVSSKPGKGTTFNLRLPIG